MLSLHHLNGACTLLGQVHQVHVLLVSFAIPMLRATSQNEHRSDKKASLAIRGLRIRDCLTLKRFGRREMLAFTVVRVQILGDSKIRKWNSRLRRKLLALLTLVPFFSRQAPCFDWKFCEVDKFTLEKIGGFWPSKKAINSTPELWEEGEQDDQNVQIFGVWLFPSQGTPSGLDRFKKYQ